MAAEITFTTFALGIATPAQCESLAAMAWEQDGDSTRIEVATGGFDLPSGYLSFVIDGELHGGVAPDGRVST